MLINRFMPTWHFAERHHTLINAPAPDVFEAVRALDVSDAPIIRLLFRLRGMPSTTLRLDGLLKVGFVLLGEAPNEELLLGLIGRFWTPRGDLQRVTPDGFVAFNQSGYAKTVWNFALKPDASGATLLSTETRIQCLDDASRRRFGLYWMVIGPFSALIRRQMLQSIKRQTPLG